MSESQQVRACIAVNQVGYRTDGRKTAVFAGTGGRYRLADEENGRTAWSGETGPAAWDESSGRTVCRADFSAWREPGVYRIESEDGERSPAFRIADDVYEEAGRALLKAFYFFRCGTELAEQFAGPWRHGKCHLTPAIVYGDESRRIEADGGWHDAGDYGKYVVAGAKAAADLMLALELYPGAFARSVPLPETDGRMPDVLHETRWELEWLLKMQDGESGGAFHKLTTLRFPAENTMPEDDAAELYLSPISATATGCLAGVMAMAARAYAPYDEVFAGRCLACAEKAWAWLEAHPDVPGFKNPPEIVTGEYGDPVDLDERYWAAAELYRATGEERYREAFRTLAADESFDKYELGWADMGGYGTIAYLLAERPKDASLAASLTEGWKKRAETLAAVAERDGYGVSLRPEDYIWGSNMVLLNNAMLLLLADRLAGTNVHGGLAADHVHYLYGMNATGYSYVTGSGSRPIMHPHHRPSEGDGVDDPVPGLVSGGPNRGLQDDYAREHLSGLAPALCFADVMETYSTNEVTIYWNSPAVFVLAAFAAGNPRP